MNSLNNNYSSMGNSKNSYVSKTGQRSLLTITLEEAIEAIKIADGIYEDTQRKYHIKKTIDLKGTPFIQLYYVINGSSDRHVVAAFSDSHDVVAIKKGNFRKEGEVHTYLIEKGFNVIGALLQPCKYYTTDREQEFIKRLDKKKRTKKEEEHIVNLYKSRTI
ncbi:MAG TPA: hypothetical protein VEC16_06165 [Alphaproteobacteria bacterium]|nr:hypothetical protein [Alphaproteobacteria bacterium]